MTTQNDSTAGGGFEETTDLSDWKETSQELPVTASVLAQMKELGVYQGDICSECDHKAHEPGECGRQMSEELSLFECACPFGSEVTDDHSRLTPTEQAYIALDKKKAEVKKFFDDLQAATEALVAAHGVGHYFQDEEGVVYKTVEPEGKFVHFEKFSVYRTRRLSDGEKAGQLSLTEARVAGFEVEGK